MTRLLAVAGMLGMALLAEISGNLLGLNLLPVISHHAQFALLCASLALLWMVFTALGNTVLVVPTWAPRYVVVFPALALATALGVHWTLSLILSRPYRLAVAVTIGLAIAQAAYYFGPHLYAYNRQFRVYRDGQDAIFRSQSFPPGTQVHVYAVVPLYPNNIAQIMRYLELDDLRLDVLWKPVTPELLASLPRDVDNAFFIHPADQAGLILIRRYFDVDPPQWSPYNVPRDKQLVLYYAPAQPAVTESPAYSPPGRAR